MPVISRAIQEGALTFTFPANGMASKYDEWSHYRNQLVLKLRTLIKAIDPHPSVVDMNSLHPTMNWCVA